MRRDTKRLSIPLLATLLLALGASLYLYPALSQSFFEPTGGFPGSNTETPLNVGPLAQVKQGALTLLSTLDLSNTRGVNLKDPINPQDAVTKGYVDRLARGGGWVECASFTDTDGDDIDGSWDDGCTGHTVYKFSCGTREYIFNTDEPVDFEQGINGQNYYWPGGSVTITPELHISKDVTRLYGYQTSTGAPFAVWSTSGYFEDGREGAACGGAARPDTGDEYWISFWDPSITLQASFPTMPTCPAYVMGEKGSIMTAPRPFFENYVVCKNRETGYVPHCQLGTSCEQSCSSPDNSASMVVKTSINSADCFRATGSTFNISEACHLCMIR